MLAKFPGSGELLRYLGEDGALAVQNAAAADDAALLLGFYRAMSLTRTFDKKAVALQRVGKLGTFASSLGQEAVGVGVASAMRAEDVLVPTYRDHAAQLLRGVTMVESLLYWGGDERGSNFAGPRSDFPNNVPIGTQVPHAVGAAYSFKLRRERRVAVCLIGDGGTSKGDFYEALNIAGVWRAPVVVFINNNQWAISMPRAAQSAAVRLADKATAAGIDSLQIDGNDVIAVHEAARAAIESARAGDGPTVIEALTYRLGDHTTADDASRYRAPEELQEAWKREPVARLRAYLVARGWWSKEQEVALARECAAEVDAAVDAYLSVSPQPVEAMFDWLYAELPDALREQRETALRYARPRGSARDE